MGIFTIYNRTKSYARRLRDVTARIGHKVTEADCKAVASILEDREAARELIERVQRLRDTQREIARYEKAGVSIARGLDEAKHREVQLAGAVDRDVAEYLKQFPEP